MTIKPLEQRATLVVVFLAITIVGAALSMWADLSQGQVIQRFIDGDRVTLAELEASDDRVQWTFIVYLVGTVPAIIAWLMWQSRLRENVMAMGAYPRWSARWAIGCWFVPIISLFRPKQVINDLWRGTNADSPRELTAVELQERPVAGIVHWWWAMWILSIYAGNALFRNSIDDTSPENARQSADVSAFADLTDIVAAILAIVVVRRLTARSAQRAARLA